MIVPARKLAQVFLLLRGPGSYYFLLTLLVFLPYLWQVLTSVEMKSIQELFPVNLTLLDNKSPEL